MAKVRMPPGCYGTTMEDGTKYRARPGGTVDMDDRHASAIKKSRNGQLGIISTEMSAGISIGTRVGRRCQSCQFLGQAWAIYCPKCGGETEEE